MSGGPPGANGDSFKGQGPSIPVGVFTGETPGRYRSATPHQPICRLGRFLICTACLPVGLRRTFTWASPMMPANSVESTKGIRLRARNSYRWESAMS